MTVYLLCYIAMLCYVSCVSSYYYCNMLTPRRAVKHPRRTYLLLSLPLQLTSIPLVMSVGNEPCLPADLILHISVILMPFLLFEGTVIHKITAYILLFFTFSMVEAITATFQGVWFFLLGYGTSKSFFLLKQMPLAITVSTATLLSLGAFIFSRIVPVLKYTFRNYDSKTVYLLMLPLVTIPVVHNILYYTHFSVPVQSLLFWFLCIPCYFSLNKGIRRVKAQEQKKLHQQKQLEIMKNQLDYSQHLESEYQNLRKWNHDIANHLISLNYLMENGRTQEAAEYCRSLISCPQEDSAKKKEAVSNEV